MEEAVVLTDDGDDVLSEKNAEEIKTEKKKKKRTKLKAKKLILNVSMTKYHVVRYVAKQLFNMRLSGYSQSNHDCYDEKHEWDLLWTDGIVTVDKLYRMKPF